MGKKIEVKKGDTVKWGKNNLSERMKMKPN